MHPTRCARVVVAATGQVLGAVGEVDPSAVAAYGLTGRVGVLSVSLEAVIGRRFPRAEVGAGPGSCPI